MTLSHNVTYKYHPRYVYNIVGSNRKEGVVLPCSAHDRNISTSHLCEESLVNLNTDKEDGGIGGNWSSCSSTTNLKLMVYAECKTSHVELPLLYPFLQEGKGETIQLELYQIGSLLSLLDAILMVLILIFLFWLEQKETEEISMSTEGICTGGDYTVFSSFLPYHHDMAQLKRQIAKFLERELSKATPVFRDGPVEVSDDDCTLHEHLRIQIACLCM